MSAVPRFLLAAAACAAPPPTPAFGSPYTDTIEIAVFDLCPALRDGRISADNPTELTRLGFFRTPEVEEDWTDAEDGAPHVFTRGRGAEAVTIAYWSYPEVCSLRFAGRQAAAAAARVKARLAGEPRRYEPLAEANWQADGAKHEAWRTVARSATCLTMDTTDAAEPTSYDVSQEPMPVLHPGLARSACESGAPQ